jgi:hypothetical protein
VRFGQAKSGRDANDRRSHVASVIEYGKGQRKLVARFPDSDYPIEGFSEYPVSAFGESFSPKARERFRGTAEACACAADEEDAGYVAIRHGSE